MNYIIAKPLNFGCIAGLFAREKIVFLRLLN